MFQITLLSNVVYFKTIRMNYSTNIMDNSGINEIHTLS